MIKVWYLFTTMLFSIIFSYLNFCLSISYLFLHKGHHLMCNGVAFVVERIRTYNSWISQLNL